MRTNWGSVLGSWVVSAALVAAFMVLGQQTARCQASSSAPLTNADVEKMVSAKLGDGVIIAKIKSSTCKFDTSTDELIKLKGEGVSDQVVQAMTECGAPHAEPAAAAPATGAPASSPARPVSEIGVYYKAGDEWKDIEPEVVNTKGGGVLKSIATDGLMKGDVNGNINGAHSGNQVRTPVEILIYVPEGVGITEYQLLHLHEHKDSREFRTQTGGVLHKSSGSTRDLMQFTGKKIAERTYVIELGTIGAGEYGFLPPGDVMSSSGGSIGRMYTFRVLE